METTYGLFEVNGNSLYVQYHRPFENRPTIVFLHDSLGCVALWRDFPKLLGDAVQCNILVYDRLGYGKSDAMPTFVRPVNYMEFEADSLNELLAQLEITDAVLFGHSDGGTIALLTAIRHPYRIKMIVCEAAHVFVEDITLKGILAAIDAYETSDLHERLAKYHGDNVEMLFKAWTLTWTRNDFRDWNIVPMLRAVMCPLLFIQGEADEFGTLAQVDETVANVSGTAEKYIIENAGHTPHKEVPLLVLERAKIFIQSFLD